MRIAQDLMTSWKAYTGMENYLRGLGHEIWIHVYKGKVEMEKREGVRVFNAIMSVGNYV